MRSATKTPRLLVVAAVSLLAAAQPARAASAPPGDSWTKALARRGVDPSVVENPIAVTPAIKAAAESFAGGVGGTIDELRRIQNALFDRTRFTFDYDAGLTETAAEALASGRGNCVAFTNLFIAMARSRGLAVKAGYMRPRVGGMKRGDLVYVTTHVVAVYPLHDRFVVFDFYRTREDPTTRIRLLDDLELAALYLNNRAVDAMGAGDYASAERQLLSVVQLAPEFAAGHGNLGVLRRRRGDTEGAFDAYRKALALDPRDPSILGNLAALYRSLGREREAKEALALADLSRATPYTILARGDLEAADGRTATALALYRRAARLNSKIPDPQVSIARLSRSVGRLDDARRAARRAIKLDPENQEARAILAALAEAGSR